MIFTALMGDSHIQVRIIFLDIHKAEINPHAVADSVTVVIEVDDLEIAAADAIELLTLAIGRHRDVGDEREDKLGVVVVGPAELEAPHAHVERRVLVHVGGDVGDGVW